MSSVTLAHPRLGFLCVRSGTKDTCFAGTWGRSEEVSGQPAGFLAQSKKGSVLSFPTARSQMAAVLLIPETAGKGVSAYSDIRIFKVIVGVKE